MKRSAKLLFLPLLTLFIRACDLFSPEYAGTWIDDETLPGWTITLEFERNKFSISKEFYDSVNDLTVGSVTSGVMKAGSGVMETKITGQEMDGVELGDPELHAYLAYIGGGDYRARYEISNTTMVFAGELVEKVLSLTSVSAAKQ